jgi:hypothetical protein
VVLTVGDVVEKEMDEVCGVIAFRALQLLCNDVPVIHSV